MKLNSILPIVVFTADLFYSCYCFVNSKRVLNINGEEIKPVVTKSTKSTIVDLASSYDMFNRLSSSCLLCIFNICFLNKTSLI